MATTQIPAAVSGYFAALRNNDPAAFANVFAPEGVSHDPVGSEPLVGRDAVRSMLAGFLPSWGRFDGITEDEAFMSGDAVTVRWTGHGVAPSGGSVGAPAVAGSDRCNSLKDWSGRIQWCIDVHRGGAVCVDDERNRSAAHQTDSCSLPTSGELSDQFAQSRDDVLAREGLSVVAGHALTSSSTSTRIPRRAKGSAT